MNKAGYKPTGLFMIGFPGETKEEVDQTIKFSMSLDLKRAQFAIFHPLPGSRIFDNLKEKNKLKNIEWSKIKPSEAAYKHENLSEKTLKSLQRFAFLKFHLRPRILYYQLKEIKSLSHFWFLSKRIIDMFGLKLNRK